MEVDLFNDPQETFKCALEKYGVWPMTVWPVDMQDNKTKQLKSAIGDSGQARGEEGEKVFFAGAWREVGTTGFYTSKGFGAFNPAIASWLLNCYAPETGFCFDPFAGGGTRAIMAASYGLDYVGYEIRQEEVDAVYGRCVNAGVSDKVLIHCGDSRNCELTNDNSADFLITCPPYWNLEQYDGGDCDLSMINSYDNFIIEITKTINESYRILKSGAISCWVVGLHRDNGELITMHHDIAAAHKKAGFVQKEEIILNMVNNGAVQRVGNFEKGNKFLIRNHEYALVFAKK